MRRLTRFIAILSTMFYLAAPVQAQSLDPDALNITTSPLPISLVTKPGEMITTQLRVKNSGTKQETLKVGLMKFAASGEEGKPELKDREVGDDYFDWVTFSETQFQAEPNVWKDLTMTIKVPKSAAFGYYYAVTFSRANPTVPTTKNTATILGGTATLVLLEVDSPNAKRELKLTDFQVSKKTYEFLPAYFTVKLANTGNIHVIPSGTIYIMRGSKQIAVLPVNATSGNILPDSGRFFTAEWKDGFPVYQPKEVFGATEQNNGQTKYQLNWDLSQLKNLRFGKYTAHLTVVYDDGKRDIPLDAEVQFWVIPWRILALVIGLPLVIIGIIVYLIISRRRYRKRAYGRFRT